MVENNQYSIIWLTRWKNIFQLLYYYSNMINQMKLFVENPILRRAARSSPWPPSPAPRPRPSSPWPTSQPGSGAAPSPRGCGLRKLFGKGNPWEINGKIWEIHGKTWENPAKIYKNGDLNGKSHINCWNTLDLRWFKHQPWWKKWDLTWSKHQEWWKHCDCGKIVCQPWTSCNKQNPSTWQMKTKQLKAPI